MRLAERMTKGHEAYVYTWNSRVLNDVLRANGNKTELAEEAQDKINSLEGLNGLGSQNYSGFALNTELQEKYLKTNVMVYHSLRSISSSLIENLNIKLSKGVWLDEWKDGVDIAETGYIPVVISSNIADELNLKCGDVLENNSFEFNREKWEYIEVEGTRGYWNIDADTETFNIKVVGIISNNSRFFSAEVIPPTVTTIFHSVSEYTVDDGQYIIYCPYLYNNGETIVEEGIYDGNTLLFPDGSKDVEYYREQLEPYGYVYTMEELAYRDDDYYLTGTSEYEIHFYVTVALLIIGVVGYNLLSIERNKKIYGVYFSCGMPLKKALWISMGANGIIFVAGGIIGALWGLISADSTRNMMFDTKVYSLCVSIVFIVLMYLLSSVTMLIQMRKLTPIKLLRKEGD